MDDGDDGDKRDNTAMASTMSTKQCDNGIYFDIDDTPDDEIDTNLIVDTTTPGVEVESRQIKTEDDERRLMHPFPVIGIEKLHDLGHPATTTTTAMTTATTTMMNTELKHYECALRTKDTLVTETTTSSIFVSFSTFCADFLDAFLLNICFRGVNTSPDDRSHCSYHHHFGLDRRRPQVTVKVQATVVVPYDDDNSDLNANESDDNEERRRTKQHQASSLESKWSESHFIGVVAGFDTTYNDDDDDNSRPRYGRERDIQIRNGRAKVGTPVTSLRTIGTTARTISIPASDLISLSRFENLDRGEIVAVMKTYLPAFGALYHGIDLKNRRKRFSGKLLKETNILISQGCSVDVEAFTRLALLGGTDRVFILKAPGIHPIRSSLVDRLNSSRVVVMEGNATELHETILHQSMDLIIDLGCLSNIELLQRSLSPGGRLVCVERQKIRRANIASRLKQFVEQAALMKLDGSCIYDHSNVCKNPHSDVSQDLEYLLGLTQKRRLRPLIDRYIKARDVQVMKADMMKRPPQGAVICEPWRGILTPTSPDSVAEYEQEWARSSFWLHVTATPNVGNSSRSSIGGSGVRRLSSLM